MIVRRLVFFAALTMSGVACASPDVRPLPAPPKYASPNYAIAFDVPRDTTYCPLPRNWVGSDHGTTIFFTPPKLCGGAGYPSSARGFEPAQTPRIEIYYQYDLGETEQGPCRAAGSARLLGHQEALCRSQSDGLETLTIHGTYKADIAAEVYLTLVAPAKDEPRYIKPFLALVASVHTCKAVWTDDGKPKKTSSIGHGPLCDAQWF
jgi:hypothetical protein